MLRTLFLSLSFCSKLILMYSAMPSSSKIGLLIYEEARIVLSIWRKFSLKFQTTFSKFEFLLSSASYLFLFYLQQSRLIAALLNSTSLVRLLPRFCIFSYLDLFLLTFYSCCLFISAIRAFWSTFYSLTSISFWVMSMPDIIRTAIWDMLNYDFYFWVAMYWAAGIRPFLTLIFWWASLNKLASSTLSSS